MWTDMDEELENFLRERKARVAEDKASLQHDPPYMEIKTRPQRTYVTTVKENIPPKTQAEEDDVSVGLPLGLEYEKKKQKLLRELSMDYRSYIKQKEQGELVEPEPLSLRNGRRLFKNLPATQSSLITNLRPPSRRDAATLTEDTRGQERAPPTIDPQNRENQDLEFLERCNAASAKNSMNREKRDIAYGRRAKAVWRKEEEFATGLLIGAVDSEEVIQRKKERYRKELQEQIAEQHRNKKRERELEMKVAATGANDPEKPPDRIRQFGIPRRKEAAVETDPTPIPLDINDKPTTDQTFAPELPRVAFQSPLLDYSSALGLGPGLYHNHSQANPLLYHKPMEAPRISVYPPHPPSTLSDVYRRPPYEPTHFYRNPLEPPTPFYNHLAVPSGAHAPYWNSPPGGGVSCHYGGHSPLCGQSESSFQDSPSHPAIDGARADSHVGQFSSEKPRSTQDRILSYRDALKQQIQEQQERRHLERLEKERYEAQLEEDFKKNLPWGRGGGGAPLRDSTGNLITDLKQMHKLNEEAYSHPEQRQRRAGLRRQEPDPNDRVNGTVSVCSDPDANDRINGFAHVHTPQFARGSVFSTQPTPQQLQEQDKYKAFLKLQIDEKQRLKAEERERLRVEEEREERRLAEQRVRIQQEYEEEQEKKQRKDMEQKAKNAELIQMAEERKKETERKRKEAEEKESEAERKRLERDAQIVQKPVSRQPSPPVPTLQKRLGSLFSPRPPTVESQQSIPPLSERSLSGMQSPPVPARRNQLRAAGEQGDVFSELSALRRQLRTEQRRLEDRLQHRDWDIHSPLSDRHRERPPVHVFDMARLKLQVPVRRPSSRSTEPQNLQRIHDSLQLKYNDAESRLGSGLVSKNEMKTGAWRLQDFSDTYQSNSQRSTAQDDYLDLSPSHPNDYLRSVLGSSSRCSLLESESAFIEPLCDVLPVPSTPEEKKPPSSARERRRMAKTQDAVSSAHKEALPPQTGNRLQQEESRSRNHRNRAGAGRHRDAPGHYHANSGAIDASDEGSPPRVDPNSHQRNTRRRLATSDTLQPIRRERLVT